MGGGIHVDGVKNNEISIRRLDPYTYNIRIDKNDQEIIMNKKN